MEQHIQEFEKKTQDIIEWLRDELAGVRTNRPSAKLIDGVKVDYFGTQTPLKQIASISIEPPRDLVVSTWDKSSIPVVAKSIEAANLGLSVAVQGVVVRVSLPELTGERRNELKKLVKQIAEEARIRMRRERDEVQKKMNGAENEDEKFRAKEKLQKAVDAFNTDVSALIDRKNAEIDE